MIKTRRTPFYRSRPSRFLLLSSLGVVGAALVVPFTPLGSLFGFVRLPFTFYLVLAGLVGLYLGLVEVIKRWFYRQRALSLEPAVTPEGQVPQIPRLLARIESFLRRSGSVTQR